MRIRVKTMEALVFGFWVPSKGHTIKNYDKEVYVRDKDDVLGFGPHMHANEGRFGGLVSKNVGKTGCREEKNVLSVQESNVEKVGLVKGVSGISESHVGEVLLQKTLEENEYVSVNSSILETGPILEIASLKIQQKSYQDSKEQSRRDRVVLSNVSSIKGIGQDVLREKFVCMKRTGSELGRDLELLDCVKYEKLGEGGKLRMSGGLSDDVVILMDITNVDKDE
ncbi:hypothetical protein PTKIN_Ptkin09bG0115700 [Pterospermum kingtungense]